jgi:8-amino-7-oxononanoate synthase
MYQNQLKALQKSGRFRRRRVFDNALIDLASNDYLGLSTNKKQFQKAVKLVNSYQTLSSKASMLVNGYHPIHRLFEERLASINGFEEGIVVGSGFLANIALIESLVRKGDMLFVDKEYHASGMMASKLIGDRVILFEHNSAIDLEEKLQKYRAKRQIVAVEGVYSMSGALCTKEIFEVAKRHKSLMIVDEAHSSGVIGERLQGIFEYYSITPTSYHIKMGTLGKAYGSYGAYILASSEIISFLENRAKPIIYSTAPSIFDTALALVNIDLIAKKSQKYHKKIEKRLKIIENITNIKSPSLIIPIKQSSNKRVIEIQSELIEEGFLVGAIRQPTVKEPIIRLIPHLGVTKKALQRVLELLKDDIRVSPLSH